MAELGGINYPIKTEYDGSGVQSFIADLAFARSAFRQFKDDLQASGQAGKDFAAAERSVADNARLVQQSLTNQIAALKQVSAAAAQAAAAQRQVATAGAALPANSAALATNTAAAAGNLKQAAVQANLLNGTIVRMLVFRQLVRFIQNAAGEFKNLIKSGIEYNSTIETTKLSIAGLLDSIVIIKDAQGRTLEGAEKFAAAQGHAADLTARLNEEAIRTGVSIQELGKVFNVALGPGLQAGLSLENITKLTGEIAIAARTLNVADNRIAHELRDLTTGHIRSATDRIATSLGITNADIKRAEQAGTLFDFLQKKLQGFNAVASEAPKTFDGIVSRLKVTSEIVAGLASSTLFEELKSAGSDLLKILSSGGSQSSGIIATLRIVDDALAELVKKAHAFAAGLTLQDVQTGVRVFTQVLVKVVEVLAGALQGFGTVARTVADFFSTLAQNFGFTDTSLISISATITEIVLGFKLWGVTVALIQGGLNIIVPILGVITGLTKGVAASASQWAAAIALVPLAVKELAELITGTEVSFKELEVNALANLKRIGAGFSSLGILFKEVFLGIKNLDLTQIENASKTASATLDQSFAAIKKAQEASLNTGDDFGLVKKKGGVFRASGEQLAENLTEGFRQQLTVDQQRIFDTFDRDVQKRLAIAAAIQNPLSAREAKPVDRSTITEQLVGLTQQQSELVDKQKAETELLNLQASSIRKSTEARREGLSVSDQQILATQAQSDEMKKQIVLLEAQQAIEKKKLEDSLAANLDPTERARAINALDDQHSAALEKQKAQLDNINEKLVEQKNRAGKNGVAAAFDQMGADLRAKIPNEIEATIQIATSAINQFANFVSATIIAAFDPNNDQSTSDRFKAFLRGILVQVVQLFTQIAIAKAILGTGSGSGSGGLVGGITSIVGSLSAAQGGYVRSPGHYRRDVGSYADGGSVRPNWVDRRDTVAAWLQPGEFVMPVGAVRQYGLAMMDSLRRGSIAPAAVHAAAGVGGVHAAAKPPSGASLADGGSVAAGIGGISNNQPTPAFLVADDKAMEMMLNGGSTAFMRFMRENADQVEGILRRSRPQTR